MASNVNLSLSEDNSSGTDLSDILTENEERIDTTNWTLAKHKKLQHMKEFHEEYQRIFGEKASLQTIIKNRISHMNPPMLESVCREEMQSATQDNSCTKGNHTTEIESALHQIATSLHHATDGYLALVSSIHKVEQYELPQVIAQIPPPLIDVPILIKKALSIDSEEKVINHILRGEYELTNTSWSKLQNKYNLTKGRVYKALKGKRRPRGLQYRQKRRLARKLDTTTLCMNSETN